MPTSVVNGALTMFAVPVVELRRPLWHGRRMRGSSTRAGGFFLTICILGGFAAGLAIQNPMKGVLIGTAAGVAVAVLLWLIDRRREP